MCEAVRRQPYGGRGGFPAYLYARNVPFGVCFQQSRCAPCPGAEIERALRLVSPSDLGERQPVASLGARDQGHRRSKLSFIASPVLKRGLRTVPRSGAFPRSIWEHFCRTAPAGGWGGPRPVLPVWSFLSEPLRQVLTWSFTSCRWAPPRRQWPRRMAFVAASGGDRHWPGHWSPAGRSH